MSALADRLGATANDDPAGDENASDAHAFAGKLHQTCADNCAGQFRDDHLKAAAEHGEKSRMHGAIADNTRRQQKNGDDDDDLTSNYHGRGALTHNCGCQEGFAESFSGVPSVMERVANAHRQQLATNARRFSGADALSRLISGEQPDQDEDRPGYIPGRNTDKVRPAFDKTRDDDLQYDEANARSQLGFAGRTGAEGVRRGGPTDRQAMGDTRAYPGQGDGPEDFSSAREAAHLARSGTRPTWMPDKASRKGCWTVVKSPRTAATFGAMKPIGLKGATSSAASAEGWKKSPKARVPGCWQPFAIADNKRQRGR